MLKTLAKAINELMSLSSSGFGACIPIQPQAAEKRQESVYYDPGGCLQLNLGKKVQCGSKWGS